MTSFTCFPRWAGHQSLLLVVFGTLLGCGSSRSSGAGHTNVGLEVADRHDQREAPAEKWNLRFTVCQDHRKCGTGQFCSGTTRTCRSCQWCEYHSSSIDGRCPQDRCPGTPTKSTQDQSPPELAWLFLTPPVIDIREEGKRHYVDIFMYLTDRGSGFSVAQLTFLSSSGEAGIRTFSYASIDDISGNPNAGVFQGRFWFESYDEGGLWQLGELRLQDAESNIRVYNAEDLYLFSSDVNATVEVVGNHYRTCSTAAQIDCGSRNAECRDKWMRDIAQPVALCRCNEGYTGDAFTCLETSEVEDFYSQFQQPPGTWDVAGGGNTQQPSQPVEPHPDPDAAPSGPYPTQEPEEERTDNPNPYKPQEPWSNSRGDSLPDPEDVTEEIAWSSGDSKIVGLVLACTLVIGLTYHSIKHHKFLFTICCKRRYRNGRIGPTRRVNPQHGQPTRPRDPDSLEAGNYAWSHGFSGSQGGRSGSQRHLRALPVMDDPGGSVRIFVRENSGGSGRRRSRSRSRPREAAVEAWSIDDLDPATRALFLSSAMMQPAFLPFEEPAPPPPIALPKHISLPGAVPKEDIPEGQECAICMEAKKSSILQPCGHNDLCFGCAEHLWKHTDPKICPICRTQISGVTKSSTWTE